jgi:hypothetical protein
MGIRGKKPYSKRNGVLEDNNKKNLRGIGRVNVCHEVDACVFQGGHLRAWKVIFGFHKRREFIEQIRNMYLWTCDQIRKR